MAAPTRPKKISHVWYGIYLLVSLCQVCWLFAHWRGRADERESLDTLQALLSNNHAGALSNTVSVTNPKHGALQTAPKKTISIPDRPKVNFYVFHLRGVPVMTVRVER